MKVSREEVAAAVTVDGRNQGGGWGSLVGCLGCSSVMVHVSVRVHSGMKWPGFPQGNPSSSRYLPTVFPSREPQFLLQLCGIRGIEILDDQFLVVGVRLSVEDAGVQPLKKLDRLRQDDDVTQFPPGGRGEVGPVKLLVVDEVGLFGQSIGLGVLVGVAEGHVVGKKLSDLGLFHLGLTNQ